MKRRIYIDQIENGAFEPDDYVPIVPKIQINYRIIVDIMAVCEHHYRLGVLHGSSNYDPIDVIDIASLEDAHTTAKYLDEDKRYIFKDRPVYMNKDLKMYAAGINLAAMKMGLKHLPEYILFSKNWGDIWSICILTDHYYRKGLIDGNKNKDYEAARDFFSMLRNGSVHHQYPIYSGEKMTHMSFFENMRISGLFIFKEHESHGIGNAMYLFVSKCENAVFEDRHERVIRRTYKNMNKNGSNKF
jgi:hypothetical protein